MTVRRSSSTGRATHRWCPPCAGVAMLLASCGGASDRPSEVTTATTAPVTSTADPGASTTSADVEPEPTRPSDPPASTTDHPSDGNEPPVSAAGRRLTAWDDGATFSLAVGETAELVVAEETRAVTVEGEAVIAIRTTDFAGDGLPLYEIRAVASGHATLVFDDIRIDLIVP